MGLMGGKCPWQIRGDDGVWRSCTDDHDSDDLFPELHQCWMSPRDTASIVFDEYGETSVYDGGEPSLLTGLFNARKKYSTRRIDFPFKVIQ